MLDGQETVEIAWGELRWKKRDTMLDGQEIVQIAWGELRLEGARQHAGRIGNRAESFAGRERDSMLDEWKPCK